MATSRHLPRTGGFYISVFWFPFFPSLTSTLLSQGNLTWILVPSGWWDTPAHNDPLQRKLKGYLLRNIGNCLADNLLMLPATATERVVSVLQLFIPQSPVDQEGYLVFLSLSERYAKSYWPWRVGWPSVLLRTAIECVPNSVLYDSKLGRTEGLVHAMQLSTRMGSEYKHELILQIIE